MSSKINVREAREFFTIILDRVESGLEIVILTRGKAVGRLGPPSESPALRPSLREFLNSIEWSGQPASSAVIEERERQRP